MKLLRQYLAFNQSYLELWWRYLDSSSAAELDTLLGRAFGKLDKESQFLIQAHLQLLRVVKPSPLDPYLFVKTSAQHEIFQEQVLDRWASRGYSSVLDNHLDEAQLNLGLDEPPGSELLLDYGLAPIRRLAAEYLAEGSVIDVGAGDGVATWVFLSRYGIRKSFCFEPQDDARARLNTNIRRWQLESRVVIEPSAVGDANGKATLYGTGPGATLIGPKHGSDKSEQSVQVIKLDDWRESKSLNPICLLKVDCEGNEDKVMAGARALVTENSPILLIALYHTPDALFEMTPRLMSENPGYTWQIRKTGPELVKELTLVGLPPALSKSGKKKKLS